VSVQWFRLLYALRSERETTVDNLANGRTLVKANEPAADFVDRIDGSSAVFCSATCEGW
jgi:hypothetical protein